MNWIDRIKKAENLNARLTRTINYNLELQKEIFNLKNKPKFKLGDIVVAFSDIIQKPTHLFGCPYNYDPLMVIESFDFCKILNTRDVKLLWGKKLIVLDEKLLALKIINEVNGK